MPTSDAIVRFAEEPDFEMPAPWPPGRRFVRPSFTLALSPSPSLSRLARVRTTELELDATIAEVRGLLREHAFVGCSWFIGPSCRPVGLATLLAQRGFVPATRPPDEPHFTAMVLTRPPPEPSPDPGVEARLVQTQDEYLRALRAGLTASSEAEDVIADQLAAAELGWNHETGVARMSHIAFADGNVAGVGLVSFGPSAVLLAGAAVLPAFRGRGVYRALIASRWRAAAALGKPALTVHAGAMSRPILERCGFEEVCRIDVLADTALGP